MWTKADEGVKGRRRGVCGEEEEGKRKQKRSLKEDGEIKDTKE